MSRKNRFFKFSPVTQSPFGQPMRAGEIHSIQYVGLSSVGITTEPMPQVEGSQMASVEPYPSATAIATSQSETVSAKPKLIIEDIPTFWLKTTDCCGLHCLSGFQFFSHGEAHVPLRFVLGVAKAYHKQNIEIIRLARLNDVARRWWEETYRAQTAAGQVITEQVWGAPHVIPFGKQRPGMIICTWNNNRYDDGAKQIADFISKNGLGSCTFSGKVINPNSHNEIENMTWCINVDKYDAFVKEYEGRF